MGPGPLQQAQLLPEASQSPACTVSRNSLSPATVFTEIHLEGVYTLHTLYFKQETP